MPAALIPIVLLDANVLYPAPVRDYFLRLASLNLFKPIWSNEIQEEWIRNLLQNRTDLKRKELEKATNAMNAAFPFANIAKYQSLINRLELPDKNDRHILAAALRGKADLIVTFNLKDFPSRYLKQYELDARHPDDFVVDIIKSHPIKAKEALINQVNSLKNPPKSVVEVLAILKNCELRNSVKLLEQFSV